MVKGGTRLASIGSSLPATSAVFASATAFAQAYQAWLAAGNTPASAPAPVASTCVRGRQIVAQVKAAGVSASLVAYLHSPEAANLMPTSILYWQAISLDTRVPVDKPKVANILTGSGVKDVPAFMAAALQLPA